MRPIDADALKHEICNIPMCGEHEQFYAIVSEVAKVLIAAPTIDTERHARWVRKDNSKNCKRIGDFEEWYECSDCEGNSDYESEYCPNCGARMDGEEKDG